MKLVFALLFLVLINGCSLHPYVLAAGKQTSLPIPTTTTNLLFAGDLEQAINDVDTQRNAYYKKLENRTSNRNLLSGGLTCPVSTRLRDIRKRSQRSAKTFRTSYRLSIPMLFFPGNTQ